MRVLIIGLVLVLSVFRNKYTSARAIRGRRSQITLTIWGNRAAYNHSVCSIGHWSGKLIGGWIWNIIYFFFLMIKTRMTQNNRGVGFLYIYKKKSNVLEFNFIFSDPRVQRSSGISLRAASRMENTLSKRTKFYNNKIYKNRLGVNLYRSSDVMII